MGPNAQMSTPRRGQNPPSRCKPATAIFLNNIGGLAGGERVAHAVLRPHSSVPLGGAVGGVTSGGLRRRSIVRDVRRYPSIRPEELGHGRWRTGTAETCARVAAS